MTDENGNVKTDLDEGHPGHSGIGGGRHAHDWNGTSRGGHRDMTEEEKSTYGF